MWACIKYKASLISIWLKKVKIYFCNQISLVRRAVYFILGGPVNRTFEDIVQFEIPLKPNIYLLSSPLDLLRKYTKPI